MKLASYMKVAKLAPSDLAGKLGVSTWAVYKWLSRGSLPKPATVARLQKFTKGAVRYEDLV